MTHVRHTVSPVLGLGEESEKSSNQPGKDNPPGCARNHDHSMTHLQRKNAVGSLWNEEIQVSITFNTINMKHNTKYVPPW